ncbi:MAG: hypothetical protein KF703_12080, partial [Actinobacteria bacterium]|nr:hypothetical protein [Actinomycetota bacterium]
VAAASVPLPQPYDPRNRVVQRQVANHLRKARLRHRTDPVLDVDPASARLARDARELPVARCPELDRHLSAATERDRLRSQIADLDRRLDERVGSLGRQFDRITALLEGWGFVSGWSLTASGEVLARVFHESDLLCAAVVTEGLLDGLDPPSLAGVVSMLTYEHRSKEPPPAPWYPSRLVRERAKAVEDLARRLARDEVARGLSPTRHPDPSFLALAHAWASGTPLDVVMADDDVSGGDFVRTIKTLIDLVRQVGEVAPDPATRQAARAAADALFRGVVSASSDVSVSAGPGPAAAG